MNHQLAIQKLFQERITEAKAKNPAFSLRSFARKLGLSPAMTSRVLSGKRSVSLKTAHKLIESLIPNPQERAEFLASLSKPERADTVDPQYLQLSADQFKLISEWHYLAILSLLKTKGFQNKPSWIAARLGITVAKAEDALTRLKRLELIAEDKKGNLKRTSSNLCTSDNVFDASIRRAHLESFELAKNALEHQTVDVRDCTSLTLAFAPERMKEAKEFIRRFQDEFDARFETPKPALTEVYRLFIQFFPLTKENL
jgi:uncharacterized protein (TIGR02147 family)